MILLYFINFNIIISKLNNKTKAPAIIQMIKKLLLIKFIKDSPNSELPNTKGINAITILVMIPNSSVNTLLSLSFFLSILFLVPLFINIWNFSLPQTCSKFSSLAESI
ncbi:hypothetical protein SDC9_183494 [bioreactor metagenome]|uniref:Uncharacterized protein n=1 Tax=bioreactor metagenome TaxID=1076179 RepID=A0A645HCY6_9ZZZZ